MPGFLVAPDGPERHPAVIFYMDAPGIREELRNLCRRIAKHGYVCLLPDMYCRFGLIRFDIPRRDDGMSAVIRAAMNHLSNALVADDTPAMIGFHDAQDAVKPGPIGCVGHCMSGRYITAAARSPRVVATASLYGVGIVTEAEDSPHLLLNDVRGELYYAFAEHDQSVPPSVVPALTSALEKAGTKHTREVYPGTPHGFCFPSAPCMTRARPKQRGRRSFPSGTDT